MNNKREQFNATSINGLERVEERERVRKGRCNCLIRMIIAGMDGMAHGGIGHVMRASAKLQTC